jgi:hypothetical protein
MLSLQKSVRSARADPGWADKSASTRYLDACSVVCPVHNLLDQYGREAHPDTLKIETAGCRSASSRVDVENYLRPQYFSFVTLDNFGIAGDLNSEDSQTRTNTIRSLNGIVGSAGYDYGANIRCHCGRDTHYEFEHNMTQ